MTAALSSSDPSTALAGALAFLGSFFFFHLKEIRGPRQEPEASRSQAGREQTLWASLLFFDIVGVGAGMAGLLFGTHPWNLILTALCLGIAILGTTILGLTGFISVGWSGDIASSLRSSRGWRWALRAAAAIALLAAGLVLGVLVDSGTNPPSPPMTGDYQVEGTCGNGSCVLNECAEPAPCGLRNVGRLREGRRIEIECQILGTRATAPNRRSSRIWDRIAPGLFVSDLFVDTPGVGSFSPHLKRCVT